MQQPFLFCCIFAMLKSKRKNIMFGYQYPTWLPIAFFVVLMAVSYGVGKWLVKNDRDYKGF